jgi:hypothetical protein
MTTTIETQQRVAVAVSKGAVRRLNREHAIFQVRDSSQAWFWTAEWQSGEQVASRELREGREEIFETAEDFLASLDE